MNDVNDDRQGTLQPETESAESSAPTTGPVVPEHLTKEAVIDYARKLVASMTGLGLGSTWQIEKLKKVNEPLYEKLCRKMRDKFDILNASYPGIVNAILGVSSDFKFEMLEMMLDTAEKVRSGTLSEKEVMETHVKMSKMLRDIYVLPKLGINPDDLDEIEIDLEKIKAMDMNKTNIKLDM